MDSLDMLAILGHWLDFLNEYYKRIENVNGNSGASSMEY
jgi:hypothetical protein